MSVQGSFDHLEARLDQRRLAGIEHSFLFDIEGEGRWLLIVHDGSLAVTEGDAPADVMVTVSAQTLDQLAMGHESPSMAFMNGKLTYHGDLSAAQTLQNLF